MFVRHQAIAPSNIAVPSWARPGPGPAVTENGCYVTYAPSLKRPLCEALSPPRAKVEILNHLDGDLVIVPRPSSGGGADRSFALQ